MWCLLVPEVDLAQLLGIAEETEKLSHLCNLGLSSSINTTCFIMGSIDHRGSASV